MKKHLDLTGMRFTRLTVTEFFGKSEKREYLWKCRCDCGETRIVPGPSLRSGNTRSCGCLQSDIASKGLRERRTTHGMARTGERTLTWKSWTMMMQRCTNPNRDDYHNYGGRGIVPCDFIKAGPQNLAQVIGPRPDSSQTLERIDNSLGYNCGQCEQCIQNAWVLNMRWTSKAEQARNKRNNIWLQLPDERILYVDAIAKYGRRHAEAMKTLYQIQ